MEIISSPALIWVVLIGAVIAGIYLYKKGKIPWLKGVKMPKLFEPKPDDMVEKLVAQTEREMARAEELRKVLEAKRKLAKAKAENIRLQREIDGVSEKSVEREERDAEKSEQDKRGVEKAKPRRL